MAGVFPSPDDVSGKERLLYNFSGEDINMFRQFNDPFALIAMAVVGAGLASVLWHQLRVRTQGIETTAVITQITEETISNSDGISTYLDYHVVYTDRSGRRQYATLANPGFSLEEGDEVIIRYVEDAKDAPVYIRKVQ